MLLFRLLINFIVNFVTVKWIAKICIALAFGLLMVHNFVPHHYHVSAVINHHHDDDTDEHDTFMFGEMEDFYVPSHYTLSPEKTIIPQLFLPAEYFSLNCTQSVSKENCVPNAFTPPPGVYLTSFTHRGPPVA